MAASPQTRVDAMVESLSEFQATSVSCYTPSILGHKFTHHNQVADISAAAVPGKSTLSFTEIPVLDGERAVAFYNAVLGWEFHPEFTSLPNHSPETSAAKRVWCFSVGHRVLGAFHEVDPEYAVTLDVELGSKKLAVRTSWNVEDISETTEKVLANGGKVYL